MIGLKEGNSYSGIDKIIVRNDKNEKIIIECNTIGYIEAANRGVVIYTDDDKIYKLSRKISELDKYAIDSCNFVRTHRSYIINMDKIEKYGSTYVVINKKLLPLSRNGYKNLENRITSIAYIL